MYRKIDIDYSTLNPYLNDDILDIHYNIIYQSYLDKLNYLIKKNNYSYFPLSTLAKDISVIGLKDRDEILFNLGGVINHSLYFYGMSDKNNNIPVGKIKEDINRGFGNYENFKVMFKNSALNLVGSGYTFLVLDKDGKLRIINTSNEDTPYYYGFIPVLTIDLWEHSYYLQYNVNKEKYIEAWFNLIDYDKVNKLYTEEIKKIPNV